MSEKLKPQPVVGPGLKPREEPGDKEPFSQVETELRARADYLIRCIREACFDEGMEEAPSGDKRRAESAHQRYKKYRSELVALLQPKNPTYDSPDGWWLRLSGKQRTYLCKRYPEMGVTDDASLHDTCSSVPGSGADEHATAEPVGYDWMFWSDAEASLTRGDPREAYSKRAKAGDLKFCRPLIYADSPRENAEPERVAMTLYAARCGWCGAYEGIVDPEEPCAKDPATGEFIGPHQFEELEEFAGTLYTSPPQAGRDSEAMEKLEGLIHAEHGALEFGVTDGGEIGVWFVGGDLLATGDYVEEVILKADSILATEGDEKK